MRSMTCENEKGISLIESLVAMLLLTIGIIAIMTMQPTSMKTGANRQTNNAARLSDRTLS